jgi:hypothetical protein
MKVELLRDVEDCGGAGQCVEVPEQKGQELIDNGFAIPDPGNRPASRPAAKAAKPADKADGEKPARAESVAPPEPEDFNKGRAHPGAGRKG